MLNTAKERKQRKRQRLNRLALLADRFDGSQLHDKQDAMLCDLDDGWECIRQKIIELAGERGEWAGYPLPVEHTELVIEPRHPLKSLQGATLAKKPYWPHEESPEIVNAWIDHRGWTIVLARDKSGRTKSHVLPKNPETARLDYLLKTFGASQAWSVSAEFSAMARLKTLVTSAAFRYYLLVGAFLESSQRSNVLYVFRKGRPTLALSKNCETMKPLAALCLHPIGYYEDTHAGSMVPTDDVIAHLLMMRGDERLFWAKCNQHELSSPASGL